MATRKIDLDALIERTRPGPRDLSKWELLYAAGLLAARGVRVAIEYPTGLTEFTAGGKKRHAIGAGMIATNGRVRFADGAEAWAVLEIDVYSSGEHGGTGIFLPGGGMTWQGDPDFLAQLGKTKEQVFPYRYRYDATLNIVDHHVGPDGWSTR